MLHWLTENFWVLGSSGQNWMLVAGGGLLMYGIAFALNQRRETRRVQRQTPTVPPATTPQSNRGKNIKTVS